MRVASLENLLVLATLVSAIIVVLWGIKIYCGVWTGRGSGPNAGPPVSGTGARKRNRTKQNSLSWRAWRQTTHAPEGGVTAAGSAHEHVRDE